MSNTTNTIQSTTIQFTGDQFILNDNGTEIILTKVTKDGLSLILPENSSGRKFFALKKFEKKNIHELLPINRDTDPEHTSTPKYVSPLSFPKSHLKIHEQMTREEISELRCFEESIQIYMELMDRVIERIHSEKRPLTEIEKAQRRVERAQKALEELINKEIQG